jgi:hypothetical protein
LEKEGIKWKEIAEVKMQRGEEARRRGGEEAESIESEISTFYTFYMLIIVLTY